VKPEYVYPIWLAAGLIFGAGGAWAIFERTRKDVNALGKTVQRDRWNEALAHMVLLDRREDREAYASMRRMP
jgi:hypothetical protein